MTLLVEAIKVALIVVVALGLMSLLRNRPAALRHWVLSAALLCAAIAPVVRLVVPSWPVPIPFASPGRELVTARHTSMVETSVVALVDVPHAADPKLPAHASSRRAGMSFGTSFQAVWLVGVGVGIGVLLVGLARLSRIASGAWRIPDGAWNDRAREICRELGLRRPVILLQSSHPHLLVTWGVVQPKILLPAGAGAWPDDRIRLVLYHELAHIRRGDWIVQLAAEVLRAVYWFNPFLWIACRRLRQESEYACDDVVINRGVDGSAYATHLVHIARELRYPRMWVPAPSVVRTSSLERRVRAMLDTRVNRRPISRMAYAATLLTVLAVTIPVAAAAVAQAVFVTVAGSVVDPMNAALPDVTVVLTNPQTNAKYEVRSDRTGRYEFAGVPSGEYVLEARLPGFAVLHGTVSVAGQNVQRDFKLQVGSLEETITVRASATRPDTRVASPPDLDRIERYRKERQAAKCGSTPSPDGTPIGGNIRPPAKLHDVHPLYPASALNAGVEGSVVLHARIGTDGAVEDVQVVSTPHADLASSAVDAVRQWQFSSTLLNCVPIAVNIGVTVNFQREP